ncbi:aminopeptidase N-like [Rhagoletis pomonella]|uniref:aminopeptidase N-like n=1 Tax=Rhagoletis pomonella TaxID=28610 RepID=UPI00177F8936|nr:aminopeptidase N-like [Rhagoletis pomonella]XP_036342063.1 aminopeptidase N-like [Rhagoletis pomonella]
MNSKITILLLLLACSSVKANNGVFETSYRLGDDAVPDAYDIWLKPYLLATDGTRRFTFDGEVNITLHSTRASIREITLHKNLIEINGAWLYNSSIVGGGLIKSFDNDDLTYNETTHKLTVHLGDQQISNNNYTLRFKYTGQIRDGLQGFFRANYTDSSGNEKWIGLTQSQRIDARTIFPCFDEPAFKATFRLQLSRPTQYNVVFNSKLLDSIPDGDGRALDRFAATPPMSTYLFAFIVSEFAKRGSEDLKIITRAEYINKTDFAYQVSEQAIKAYDEYTQLPYKQLGLTIMQKAGSPKFPYNGMENWGLVIYSDDVLVNEPGYTDGWSNKEYTISIIVHETAHMWFGDSVTFAWWSYFWLNEAFARYYQYFMAHKLYPEYQLDQQFVVNQIHLIFGIDAVNSTQPMTSPETEIQNPIEIGYKFSSIAYAKGASILRMIANLMGVDNFDTAIRAYLKEFHLKNTVPDDFFKHLKRYWPSTPAVDLDQFFYDWTSQAGFPVLFVNVTAEHTIKLTQSRFLLDSSDGSDSTLSYIIPITYASDTDPNFDDLTARFYLSRNSEMTFHTEKPNKWIIFNLQQSNYYRVFYDNTTLLQIQKALLASQHSGIPPTNRAQLVDDLFNFARVAMLDYDRVFEFMEYLAHETEYLPWNAMFSNLPRVSQRLTVQQHKHLISYLSDIMAKVYKHLGFGRSNDTVLDIYNRNKVISWACMYHLFDCGKQAQQVFDAFKTAGNKPTPDFRETLYCSAARDGTMSYYKTLNDWFDNEKLPSEKQKLIRAMGCTRSFYEFHYAKILSGNLTSEYAVMGITPMYAQNPENVDVVFALISNTIEKLAERIGGWSNAANVISDITNYFTTLEQKKKLDDFVANKGDLFGGSVSKLLDAVKTVEMNLKWAEDRLPKLLHYLESRNAAGISSFAAVLIIVVSIIHVLL